jgi:four helix bundle protein
MTNSLRGHRDLIVWQKAMRLFVGTWRLARGLPSPEMHDLASQLRRTSLSIPSNIAEGFGRDHLGDYLRSLSISRGSSAELDTQLLGVKVLFRQLKIQTSDLLDLDDEVSRMLAVLSRKLRLKTDHRRRGRP